MDYFGYNDGVNLTMSDSNGILISRKNVLQTKCESNNKMTPYFIKSVNVDVNFRIIQLMNTFIKI